jgi:hypothetical protein
LLNPHEIVIQLPTVNRQFHSDYKHVWDETINQAVVLQDEGVNFLKCDRAAASHARRYHKLEENEHRKWRIVILTFPTTMHLSNSLYSPESNSNTGIINMYAIPMMTDLRPETAAIICNVRLVWRVHIHDEDAPRVATSSINGPDAIDKLNSILGRINIGGI